MHRKQQNLIIRILVAVLLMGATANAAAGVKACPPEACCCTPAMSERMQHADQEVGPFHCPPEKPAPCCQIEQDQAPTHMAISVRPEIMPQRSLIALAPSSAAPETKDRTALTTSRLLDDGRPKAPLIPIYLQTQSILC